MKIRIKFSKSGVMKFIGHLDIMRYFQKAIRRAQIDICYSEGYSPHQIMSFAAPLGVGITSEGEYLDIEVHSSLSTQEAIDVLNANMVDGIKICGYQKLPDTAKTAMSIVAAADYELYFKDGVSSPASTEVFETGIKQFFYDRPEVIITKTTKKSQREIDIKPLIYEFKIHPATEDGQPSFYLKLSTGSTDNLKPELVVEALFEFMGLSYEENEIQIHRLDVYAKTDTDMEQWPPEFISLGAMGTDI